MKRYSLERKQRVNLLLASIPVSVVALAMAIFSDISIYLITLGISLQLLLIIGVSYHSQLQISQALRGLATVVDAAKVGEYAIRASKEPPHSALADLVDSVNELSRDLSRAKISFAEKHVLLQMVFEQIPVGIIAADATGNVVNINPAAKRIMSLPADTSVKTLEHLPFAIGPEHISSYTLSLTAGDIEKRVFIQQSRYFETAEEHRLIILTEVDFLLRQERFKSWEDLVRVISHEINNTLAPISSIAESLAAMVERANLDEESRNDMLEGAHLIADRAKSLIKFMGQYRNISDIQAPNFKPVSVKSVIDGVLPLFENTQISCDYASDIQIEIDLSQIQQVLINLIKNADESNRLAETESGADGDSVIEIVTREVFVKAVPYIEISVLDSGVGLANSRNIFVPFYSTKSGGSGIGLVLSQQIIERHNGTLELANRPQQPGCVATLKLPLKQ